MFDAGVCLMLFSLKESGSSFICFRKSSDAKAIEYKLTNFRIMQTYFALKAEIFH